MIFFATYLTHCLAKCLLLSLYNAAYTVHYLVIQYLANMF